MFSALVLSGCVTPARTVRARHAAEFGCSERAVQVQRLGASGTYQASGCGEVALYVCASNYVCVLDGRAKPPASSSGAARAGNGVSSAPKGLRVERSYNEARKVHMVRGEYEPFPGLKLSFTGAPEISPEQVVVVLKGRAHDRDIQECHELSIRINAEPLSTTENKSRSERWDIALESRIDVRALAELAKDYATFEVSACSRTWKFSKQDIEEMRKFLVIYGQLSSKVASTPRPPDSERL